MPLNRVASFPTQENEIADLQAALLWLLPPHLDFIRQRAPDYPTRDELLKLAKNIGFETPRDNQIGARTGVARRQVGVTASRGHKSGSGLASRGHCKSGSCKSGSGLASCAKQPRWIV